MKTKKYNFNDDVLDVLSGMQFTIVGSKTHGVIMCELNRKLYVSVNKAIVALGGKWNRKAKAHIFNDDPRAELHKLLDNDGELKQDDYELFETPQEIAVQMIELANMSDYDLVLEPSAGNGAIANELRLYNLDIVVNELHEDRFNNLKSKGYISLLDHPCDFLETNVCNDHFDAVIQNPPFSKDIEHVYHAYDALKSGGVLVSIISEGPFFRSTKRDVAFRVWLDQHNAEVVDLPAGAFKASGTDVKARMIKVIK